MSALRREADILAGLQHVRFVPNRRHCHNPRLPSDLLFVFHLNHEIAERRIAYVRNFMP
jgi:hypothetical protein